MNRSLTGADPWRPQFHITAPQGLINDPNGLIHWRGQTHVFFQWNPDGCGHANKAWGHVVSPDLVQWQQLPVAISPDARFDSHGCYSGSAVADQGGMALLYTGNVRDAQGARESYQCLARSADGVVFDKLGPVIDGPLPGYTAHFRDPKVWAQDGEQDGPWWMVLGAQTQDLCGTVLLWRGADLTQWQPVGQLLVTGAHGYMCECPDLFALDGQTVLLFSEQHHATATAPARNIAGWVAGAADLAHARFDHGRFQPLDHGRDFYAPQTFLHADGRRILLGWMGLPEQDSAPSVAQGWFHCLTVPRELRLVDGRLCQQPIAELTALRGPGLRHRALTIADRFAAPDLCGTCYDLALCGIEGDLVLELFSGPQGRVEVELVADRLVLAQIDAQGQRSELGAADLTPGAERSLRLLADRSTVELFLDAGQIVLSARVFPQPGASGIALVAPTGARIDTLSFWPMRSAFASSTEMTEHHAGAARHKEVLK